MKRNLGNIDRVLRVLIAIVITLLSFTHVITGTLAVVLSILGVVFLFTGFIGACPLYSLFSINTCSKKQ